MGKDYSKYSGISIYDTGLIREKSAIAGRFKKNNIETLEDLFIMDDNISIDYGRNYISTSSGESVKNVNSLMRGIIKLIRYKYLDEGLYADTLYGKTYTLDSTYFPDSYIPSDITTYPPEFSRFLYHSIDGKILDLDFKNLGFNDNEIKIICNSIYKLYGETFEFSKAFLGVSEIFSSQLKEYNQYLFANVDEHSIFLEKINLISNYLKKDIVLINNNDSKVLPENKQSLTECNDVINLIEEEKKLIEELKNLNERSSKIATRISEIQELKKNNSNMRR